MILGDARCLRAQPQWCLPAQVANYTCWAAAAAGWRDDRCVHTATQAGDVDGKPLQPCRQIKCGVFLYASDLGWDEVREPPGCLRRCADCL